ncbi:MAG: hypothetical protein AABY50_07115 [Nitrospirota bacterium]
MYNFITTSVRIIQLQPFLNEYCMNAEEYKECARYKIKEKGGKSPDNLLPNGKILKI